MSNLTHKGYVVPKIEYAKAILSWVAVGVPYFFGWFATFFMGLIVAATSVPQKTHPQGKKIFGKHSDKYIAQGSSGEWEYWNSNVSFVKWWNNYEDGTLGEPSGKHSSAVKGKEQTFWSQYAWTVRNPFNYAKRSLPLFHCLINDCDIEYWGDYELSDKVAGKNGWHFCKATNRVTGKVYYWYRSVTAVSDTQVKVAAIGFKFRPSHALTVQDEDDRDKAFTVRLPVTTTID